MGQAEIQRTREAIDYAVWAGGGGDSNSPTQSARRVKFGSCSNTPEKRAGVANETGDMPPVPISAESSAETSALLVVSSPLVVK